MSTVDWLQSKMGEKSGKCEIWMQPGATYALCKQKHRKHYIKSRVNKCSRFGNEKNPVGKNNKNDDDHRMKDLNGMQHPTRDAKWKLKKKCKRKKNNKMGIKWNLIYYFYGYLNRWNWILCICERIAIADISTWAREHRSKYCCKQNAYVEKWIHMIGWTQAAYASFHFETD